MIKYDALDAERNEIRLLKLLPGDKDDLVQCLLQTGSLSHPPKYEALSYIWGDVNETQTIIVDGTEHEVTMNLHAALRGLRWKNGTRTLWVDALCINQSDLHERNGQVMKMAELYTAATRVLVWLGHETENIMSCLGWLLTHQRWNFRTLNWPIVRAALRWIWIDVKACLSERGRQDRLWQMVQAGTGYFDLITNPYWNRMWTLQEFCLPRAEPLCCYGSRIRFPLNTLLTRDTGMRISSDALDALNTLQKPVDDANISPSLAEKLLGPSRLQEVALQFHKGLQRTFTCNSKATETLRQNFLNYPNIRLAALLYRSIGRDCSDPHDRIYALYGMVPALQAAYPPDYAKPVSTVVLETVSFLLHQDQGYFTWDDFSMRRGHLDDTSYPSWVPDLTTPGPVLRLKLSPLLCIRVRVPSLKISRDLTTVHLYARSVGRCRVHLRFSENTSIVRQQIQYLLWQLAGIQHHPRGSLLELTPSQARAREEIAGICMLGISERTEEHTPAAVAEVLDAILAGTAMQNKMTSLVRSGMTRLAGQTLFSLDGPDPTSLGHLGVSGPAMRDGDELVAPPQTKIPLMLTPEQKPGSESVGQYRMVGAASFDALAQCDLIDNDLLTDVIMRPVTEYVVW